MLPVVIVAAPVGYVRVGWDRMTQHCGSELGTISKSGADTADVSYSWQWPGGFTCTFSTGETRQSLWF